MQLLGQTAHVQLRVMTCDAQVLVTIATYYSQMEGKGLDCFSCVRTWRYIFFPRLALREWMRYESYDYYIMKYIQYN